MFNIRITDGAHCGPKERALIESRKKLRDKILYRWLVDVQTLGDENSEYLVKVQSIAIHRMLNGTDSFSADSEWFIEWKKKHCIRNIRRYSGIPAASNTELTALFTDYFPKFIDCYNYHRDHIYNAVPVKLSIKSLPRLINETNVENDPENTILVMVCANASGTHKIPLFIIGQPTNPECFPKNIILPYVYNSHPEVKLNTTLFNEWYKYCFISAISKRHGNNSKCLLLIRHRSAYPSVEELNVMSNICVVMCLPPHIFKNILPMNRKIIEKLRRSYKYLFIEHLLLTCNVDEMIKSYNKWNLLMCCNMLEVAWRNVNQVELMNSWCGLFNEQTVVTPPTSSLRTDNFVVLLRRLCNDNTIDTETTEKWLYN